MDTLYLNPETWDLEIDAQRNIAKAGSPYAMAQDVATECRLYKGEYLFDTTQGIPYGNILGDKFNKVYFEAQLERAALAVPNVVKAAAFTKIESKGLRKIGGYIKVTDNENREIEIGI